MPASRCSRSYRHKTCAWHVPEPLLATVSLGQSVVVTCDSCPVGLEAKISFISREAEYTPPVIFSEQERAQRAAFLPSLADKGWRRLWQKSAPPSGA